MARGQDTAHSPKRKVLREAWEPGTGPEFDHLTRQVMHRNGEYNRKAGDWDKWNDKSQYPGEPSTDMGKSVGWGKGRK
jgi:hypothetical protein